MRQGKWRIPLLKSTEVYIYQKRHFSAHAQTAPLNPLASKLRRFVILSLPNYAASKFEPVPIISYYNYQLRVIYTRGVALYLWMAATREILIYKYFHDGHSYRVILLLLGALHGIKLSLRQLQRIVRQMGLCRRARLSQSFLRRLIRVSYNIRSYIYMHIYKPFQAVIDIRIYT